VGSFVAYLTVRIAWIGRFGLAPVDWTLFWRQNFRRQPYSKRPGRVQPGRFLWSCLVSKPGISSWV